MRVQKRQTDTQCAHENPEDVGISCLLDDYVSAHKHFVRAMRFQSGGSSAWIIREYLVVERSSKFLRKHSALGCRLTSQKA